MQYGMKTIVINILGHSLALLLQCLGQLSLLTNMGWQNECQLLSRIMMNGEGANDSSLQVDSQSRSIGLVCVSAAVWSGSTFIR